MQYLMSETEIIFNNILAIFGGIVIGIILKISHDQGQKTKQYLKELEILSVLNKYGFKNKR